MRANSIPSLLAAATLAASFALASADTIELQDGRKLSGTVSRQGNQATIKTDDGQTITTAWSDIVHVTLSGPADSPATPNAASPDLAKSEWTRIAAQIKTTPDLPKIIDLHQNFLTKYPDSPVNDQVKESLKIYQQLAAANAIKFHNKWMPPDQIDVMQKQWTEAAQPALTAYNAGNFKDALDSARAILAKDNQNPDALTLAGLAAYSAKNYGVARKYFTDLAESDPTSGLAQNNLAVVCNQQKQTGECLLHYTKALQLIATNPQLLDNIAEEINSYKKSAADPKAFNFRTLTDAYAIAEAAMEAQMAKQGLHRFGSTWATKEDLATAAKNVLIVKSQMAQLESQYKATQDAITALDAKIAQATQDCSNDQSRAMVAAGQAQQAQSANFDPGNYYYQAELAQESYNAAKDRLDHYTTQKNTFLADQKEFFAQADTLKAELANAENPFTGEQKMMPLADSQNSAQPPPATAPAIK